MDSRHQLRFKVDEVVTGTLLGDIEQTFVARIVNVSGRGVCLELDQPLPAGSAIKIEVADILVLGEVVNCRRVPGAFQVGLALTEALDHLTGLSALLDQLLGPRQVVRS